MKAVILALLFSTIMGVASAFAGIYVSEDPIRYAVINIPAIFGFFVIARSM